MGLEKYDGEDGIVCGYLRMISAYNFCYSNMSGIEPLNNIISIPRELCPLIPYRAVCKTSSA